MRLSNRNAFLRNLISQHLKLASPRSKLLLAVLALIVSLNHIPGWSIGSALSATYPTVESDAESNYINAWRAGGVQILLPADDAYVRGGEFADKNYGDESRLTVKKASPPYTREVFLRFDPSTVTGPVTTATLELVPVSVGNASALTNQVSLAADSNWSEHTVTWNSQPASQGVLASWQPVRGQKVSVDVTHLVSAAIQDGKVLSFKVYSPSEVSSDAWVHYGSKEGDAADSPRLVVNTISMLYPNELSTEPWDSSHWSNGIVREIDRSGDPGDVTGWSRKRGNGTLLVDGQGTVVMEGSQPRIYLNGLPGKFWKNVEATVYYRRIQDDGTPWGGLVIGARGGVDGHTSSDPCSATTYYGRIRHDGYADLEKELKHPDSEVRARSSVWDGQTLPHKQWVGMKFVVYNIENDSKVKLELYRDLTEGANGGQWEKLAEYTDAGGWGNAQGCGYPSDHVITQGGGIVFLRNTGVQEAHYKWFSVREITTSYLPSAIAR